MPVHDIPPPVKHPFRKSGGEHPLYSYVLPVAAVPTAAPAAIAAPVSCQHHDSLGMDGLALLREQNQVLRETVKLLQAKDDFLDHRKGGYDQPPVRYREEPNQPAKDFQQGLTAFLSAVEQQYQTTHAVDLLRKVVGGGRDQTPSPPPPPQPQQPVMPQYQPLNPYAGMPCYWPPPPMYPMAAPGNPYASPALNIPPVLHPFKGEGLQHPQQRPLDFTVDSLHQSQFTHRPDDLRRGQPPTATAAVQADPKESFLSSENNQTTTSSSGPMAHSCERCGHQPHHQPTTTGGAAKEVVLYPRNRPTPRGLHYTAFGDMEEVPDGRVLLRDDRKMANTGINTDDGPTRPPASIPVASAIMSSESEPRHRSKHGTANKSRSRTPTPPPGGLPMSYTASGSEAKERDRAARHKTTRVMKGGRSKEGKESKQSRPRCVEETEEAFSGGEELQGPTCFEIESADEAVNQMLRIAAGLRSAAERSSSTLASFRTMPGAHDLPLPTFGTSNSTTPGDAASGAAGPTGGTNVLIPRDFQHESCDIHMIPIHLPQQARPKDLFQFKAYCPRVFSWIRYLHGVSARRYQRAWQYETLSEAVELLLRPTKPTAASPSAAGNPPGTQSPARQRPASSGAGQTQQPSSSSPAQGAGGAETDPLRSTSPAVATPPVDIIGQPIEFLSADRRFVFRSITHDQALMLLNNGGQFLIDYASHIRCFGSSLLPRILGLYRYSSPTNDKLWGIVMGNVLHAPRDIPLAQTYSLKGRQPKPGRQHDRSAVSVSTDPTHGVQTTHTTDAGIRRKFVVSSNMRDRFLAQLHADLEFLAEHNLIGYNLLVGVSDLSAADLQRLDEMHFNSGVPGSICIAGGTEERPELYLVGITDIFDEYSIVKATSHFFKAFLYTSAQMSTVTPSFYATRMQVYMEGLFRSTSAALTASNPQRN